VVREPSESQEFVALPVRMPFICSAQHSLALSHNLDAFSIYCCAGCKQRADICIQSSDVSSPVKKTPAKNKAIKEIKQEIKQDVKSEPANTPKSISKRPRSISAELPIRKRPSTVTRSLKKALEDSKAPEDASKLSAPFRRRSRAQPAARRQG
jgi:hypothetical protein